MSLSFPEKGMGAHDLHGDPLVRDLISNGNVIEFDCIEPPRVPILNQYHLIYVIWNHAALFVLATSLFVCC